MFQRCYNMFPMLLLYVPKVLSCVPNVLSCVIKVLSCSPKVLSCVLKVLSIPSKARALVEAWVGQPFLVRALVGKSITLNSQLYHHHPHHTQLSVLLLLLMGFGLVFLFSLFCLLTLTSLISKYPWDIWKDSILVQSPNLSVKSVKSPNLSNGWVCGWCVWFFFSVY